MRRSFGIRLSVSFALVGILAAAATAVVVNVAFGSRFTSYLQGQQGVRVDELVAALQDSYRRSAGWDLADLSTLDALAASTGGRVSLADTGGDVVWSPTAQGSGGGMAMMHGRMMGSGPLGDARELDIRVDGSVVGTLSLRLPQTGQQPQERSFVSSVNRALLAGGIAAGLGALVVGIFLARRATAPAARLTAAARAMATGDRSHRVTVTGADEFGQMATSFNAMADTIEEEDRLRRTFAAEVAHELRTPLTILRTQIEGMQDGVVEVAPPGLASLHEETMRLGRLIEDLETMASADAAAFSLHPVDVSLADLLGHVTRGFAGRFRAAGVRLEQTLADVRVHVDPVRMRQVVSNLISNALAFTPAGGWVRVATAAPGSRALLTVADSGPGVPEGELPRIFDRFYRGSGSREGGSGIGLAVAREIVRAHGGTIEAHNAAGAGAVFVVDLPTAPRDALGVFTEPSHDAATVGPEGGET